MVAELSRGTVCWLFYHKWNRSCSRLLKPYHHWKVVSHHHFESRHNDKCIALVFSQFGGIMMMMREHCENMSKGKFFTFIVLF